MSSPAKLTTTAGQSLELHVDAPLGHVKVSVMNGVVIINSGTSRITIPMDGTIHGVICPQSDVKLVENKHFVVRLPVAKPAIQSPRSPPRTRSPSPCSPKPAVQSRSPPRPHKGVVMGRDRLPRSPPPPRSRSPPPVRRLKCVVMGRDRLPRSPPPRSPPRSSPPQSDSDSDEGISPRATTETAELTESGGDVEMTPADDE